MVGDIEEFVDAAGAGAADDAADAGEGRGSGFRGGEDEGGGEGEGGAGRSATGTAGINAGTSAVDDAARETNPRWSPSPLLRESLVFAPSPTLDLKPDERCA